MPRGSLKNCPCSGDVHMCMCMCMCMCLCMCMCMCHMCMCMCMCMCMHVHACMYACAAYIEVHTPPAKGVPCIHACEVRPLVHIGVSRPMMLAKVALLLLTYFC